MGEKRFALSRRKSETEEAPERAKRFSPIPFPSVSGCSELSFFPLLNLSVIFSPTSSSSFSSSLSFSPSFLVLLFLPSHLSLSLSLTFSVSLSLPLSCFIHQVYKARETEKETKKVSEREQSLSISLFSTLLPLPPLYLSSLFSQTISVSLLEKERGGGERKKGQPCLYLDMVQNPGQTHAGLPLLAPDI